MADVGPGAEDGEAVGGEPGAPPVFGFAPVGGGGGPADDGGAAGVGLFGDEEEAGLVEIDFEGEFDVVAEVGAGVGGGEDAFGEGIGEPAEVGGGGFEFAENEAPLLAERGAGGEGGEELAAGHRDLRSCQARKGERMIVRKGIAENYTPSDKL